MDPRRGKATQAPKVDEAAAPKGSARRARAAVKESDKSPAWPGDAQSCSSRCGSAKKSESLKKKSAQGLQAKVPQADVLGARSKKATLCSPDTQLLEAATASPLEDQEPSASPRAPFPRSGHGQEKGAKSARERKCEAGPKKAEALKESTQGPRARVPQAEPLGARSKTASLCAGDTQALDAAPLEEQEPSASLRAPLSGSGHRGQEGAESALERKSGLGPEELRSSGKAVVCTPSRRASALGVCDLKAVLEKLKLRRQEIILAAEVVNGVVDHLLRRLRSCKSEFQGVSLLHAGSYYEHVKISSPNEFDVMFKLDGCRIQLEEYGNTGAFYFVKLKRHPSGNPLSEFLEDEKLSASKMLTKFRSIIKDEIKNIADVAVQRKKRGSPAVTLLITKPEKISVDITLALESKTSWPASTQEGLPIQTWLSGKYRKELRWKPYYLVPKNAKEGNDFQEETWRLSFSHIEKHILNNHGGSRTCCENNGVKCCRKCCLKLMKYLLEQLKKKFEKRKQLSKFCSYHVKTAFFHVCTQFPNDSQWQLEDLNQCFDNCVTYFLNCLRREELNHYFIPSHNLFSRDEIDKESKDFLLQKIVHERSNGFPIFW